MTELLLEEDQLLELVQSVVQSLLGMEVCFAPPGLPCLDPLAVCLHIRGQWEGTVVLNTTHSFARAAAAVMFDLAPHRVTPDDLHDTLFELCNILGGNLKGILPGVNSLSLPRLNLTDSVGSEPSAGNCLAGATFLCAGQPLEVRLLAACVAEAAQT